MRVAAEIFNDGSGRFERRLAIDDPIFVETGIKQIKEILRVVQIALFPEEAKLLRTQEVEELAPEFAGEDSDGDEELFAGVDPGASFGQSASRDNAMQVRVER
jgi:hypothetical protein